MFTTYKAVEVPEVELSLPLYNVPLPWAERVTPEGNIIVKKSRMIIDNPESYNTDYLDNTSNISFEELVKLENLPVRITSSFRPGAKTKQGKPSNHSKKDSKGNSMAYDIVPLNGNFDELLTSMYSNPRIVNWFKQRGFGILEETTPDVMRKTGATGKHLHIGPDSSAIEMFNNRLLKGAKGFKTPYITYESVEEPVVTLDLPLNPGIDISSWSSGINEKTGIPMIKRSRMIVDNPETVEEVPKIYNTESNNNKETNLIVKFFMDKNLSKEHAVGIVANLMYESNLNPNAVNKVSGAYGIAQWLGERKNKLFKKYGKNPTLDLQLEYIWEELNSSEKNAFNRLLNTKSVEEATHSFMNFYERPSSREKADSIQNRLDNAKKLSMS